jgi:integrase
MQGYVTRKGERYYAVIYEGIDPLTGRERRRWHPAGTDQAVAERLACDLADRRRRDGGHDRGSLTLAVYLTQRWLPSKQMALRPSTWDSYRRVIELHVVPRVGRVLLRHLRPDHLERLYAELLDDGRANGSGGLHNKTVVEIHMIVRRALDDAVRRGLILTNPAKVACAPRRRPLSSNTSRVWNAQQLAAFLMSTGDHRYHAALWVTANTGMRRGEVLGLRWGDVDFNTAQLSVTRSLVSVGYELHETRGKSRTARRSINLDPRTVEVLHAWRQLRESEDPEFDVDDPDSHVFARPDGKPTHPSCSPTRSRNLCTDPACPGFASTIYATPTPPCSSKLACRSRSSANDWGTRHRVSRWRLINTSSRACSREAAQTFGDILQACADLPASTR